MAAPLEPSSHRAPTPRRAPAVLLLVAAAVLVLLGRGLGFLGGGNGEDDDASRAPTRPRFVEGDRAPTAMHVLPPEPAPPTPARPDAESTAAPAAIPAMAPATLPGERTAPPPRATPAPGAGIEADRFASIRSLITTRTESGHIGEALAAIERARTLPLSESQNAALGELRDAAEAAADRRVATLVASLREGHVGAARSAAADLLTDAPGPLHRRVLAGLGAPANDDACRAPVADERPWPIPAALAKERILHAVVGGRSVTGRVVDSRSDEVTLRVKDGDDVTFPTVRVVACEPADVTAGEAIELGFAALHAKDALLARLWLACARERGGDPNDTRAARLAALLK